jgi:hypothetical protein
MLGLAVRFRVSNLIDNLPQVAYKNFHCRGGETGRRTGLKIQRGLLHAGSIPAPGTNEIEGFAGLANPFFGAEIMDRACFPEQSLKYYL